MAFGDLPLTMKWVCGFFCLGFFLLVIWFLCVCFWLIGLVCFKVMEGNDLEIGL